MIDPTVVSVAYDTGDGGPAMTPAMIPSEVDNALGKEEVFGRRRMSSARVSSSVHGQYIPEINETLTKSVIDPVGYGDAEETTAQTRVQAGEAFLFEYFYYGFSQSLVCVKR